LYGNNGNDTFVVDSNLAAGDVLNGGAGYDVLVAGGNASIAGATTSNIETLEINGS
jgi:hypothetical protein